MMNLFADTLMIASRMEAFEKPGVTAPKQQRSVPLATRVRRWFAGAGR
jgi:hypothetical protein